MAVIGSAYVLVRPQTQTFAKEAEKGILPGITNLSRKIGLTLGGAFAAKKAFDFFKESVGLASSLTEQTSRSIVIFGNAQKAVADFAEGSAEKLALTRVQTIAAATEFGTLFRNAGQVAEAAAGMGTNLVQVATDLASLSDTSVPDALLAIKSGLAGQVEPLRRYGLEISEANIKQEAMRLGLEVTAGMLDQNVRAQAAYSLIVKQAAFAQGDFARTSDTFANQQRRLAAQFGEMQTRVGQFLIPALAALSRLTSSVLLPALEGFLRVIGAILSPLGFLADHADGTRQVLVGLGLVLTAAVIPAMIRFIAVQAALVATRVPAFFLYMAASAKAAASSLGLVTAATAGQQTALTTAGRNLGIVGAVVIASGFAYNRLTESVKKFKNELERKAGETPEQQIVRLNKALNETLTEEKKLSDFWSRVNPLTNIRYFQEKMQREATEKALEEAKKARDAEAEAANRAAFQIQFQSKAQRESTASALQLAEANLVLANGLSTLVERAEAWRSALEATIGAAVQSMRVTLSYGEAMDRLDGLFATTTEEMRATEDASGRVAAANQDLADKQAALNVLLSRQVVDLRAVREAHRGYRDALLAVSDATRRQNDLERQANDMLNGTGDQLERVTAAQEAYIRSVRSTAEARNDQLAIEQRLADLLRPAARTRQEALLDQEAAADRVKRAELGIADAEQRRAEVLADSTTSAAERQQADLDLAAAKRDLITATYAASDADAAVLALTPDGIRQSREFKDATADLAQAKERVTEAAKAEKDAGAALAALMPEGVRQSREYADVLRQLADAQRAVTDATDQVGAAGDRLREAQAGDVGRADAIAAARRDIAAATIEQRRAQEDLVAQMASLDVSFDTSTAKGRETITALLDGADAAVALSNRIEETTGNTVLAAAVLENYRLRLIASAVQAGLSADEADRLATSMGLIPKQINPIIKIRLEGSETVVTGLNRIAVAVDTLQGRRLITEGLGGVLAVTRVGANAEGGYYTREQITRIAEQNKPEVVLPLTDKARSLSLIRQAGIEDWFRSSASTFSRGGTVSGGGVNLIVQPGAIVFHGAPSQAEAAAAASTFVDVAVEKLAMRRVDAMVRGA